MKRNEAWLKAIQVIKDNQLKLRTNLDVNAYVDKFKNRKSLDKFFYHPHDNDISNALIRFNKYVNKLVKYNYQWRTAYEIVLTCKNEKHLKEYYFDPLLLRELRNHGQESKIPMYAALEQTIEIGKKIELGEFLDKVNKVLAKFHADSKMIGYVKLPFVGQFYDLHYRYKGNKTYIIAKYRKPLVNCDGGVFLSIEALLFDVNNVERFKGVKM